MVSRQRKTRGGGGTRTLTIPEGVPYEIWRIVLASEIKDGLPVVKYQYTLRDLAHAHLMLDALADTETRTHNSEFDDPRGW